MGHEPTHPPTLFQVGSASASPTSQRLTGITSAVCVCGASLSLPGPWCHRVDGLHPVAVRTCLMLVVTLRCRAVKTVCLWCTLSLPGATAVPWHVFGGWRSAPRWRAAVVEPSPHITRRIAPPTSRLPLRYIKPSNSDRRCYSTTGDPPPPRLLSPARLLHRLLASPPHLPITC